VCRLFQSLMYSTAGKYSATSPLEQGNCLLCAVDVCRVYKKCYGFRKSCVFYCRQVFGNVASQTVDCLLCAAEVCRV